MSTMTAAYHCMILATFAKWGSVGHISPITVVVQVRQVLVHQVKILAGQIFQAYLITATATKKNAEENCSQPQSSSIRNYNFVDKAKINYFSVLQTQRMWNPQLVKRREKWYAYFIVKFNRPKCLNIFNFFMMTVTAVYTACDHFREKCDLGRQREGRSKG